MDDIQYSIEALNVLHLFHDCKYMIYVEGIEDQLYWHSVFTSFNKSNFYIEDVGGKTELEKKINLLFEGNTNFIVAVDSDYDPIIGYKYYHPKIIRTFGYSIENTMYCSHAVDQTIQKLSKSIKSVGNIYSKWIETFCSKFTELLVYDIHSEKENLGLSVLGDNSARFMEDKNHLAADINKIKQKLNELDGLVGNDKTTLTRELVKLDVRETRHQIRGHFLTFAVLQFIRHIALKLYKGSKTKIDLSYDALYALVVASCQGCLNDCHEKTEMKRRVDLAFSQI